MQGENYIKIVTDCITKAWSTQKEIITEAAAWVAETIEAKKNVFVFGCSHAGILAEEVFYRTGGLAVINPIMFPGFMLNTRPITMTSALERVPGLGKTILTQNHVGEGDLLILHSVSGRNTVPVEMAIEAKNMGVRTVCITNQVTTVIKFKDIIITQINITFPIVIKHIKFQTMYQTPLSFRKFQNILIFIILCPF